MKIAVAGPTGYASYKIRAAMLAEANDWDLIDCRHHPPQRYDAIWLVKRHLSQSPGDLRFLRSHCDRLISDPLDWLASPSRLKDVPAFWGDIAEAVGVDDWIATSPACAATMAESGPRVHMLPHQSDHRIDPSWYDPDGPIVYAGCETFIRPALPSINEACSMIGRRFVCHASGYHGWKSLKGAALQICFRMPPHDGPFERNCRSQIKLANSAAGGIPAICCGTEAELSLWPYAMVIDSGDINLPGFLEAYLNSHFSSQPYNDKLTPAYTLTEFAADAKRVVESDEAVWAEGWNRKKDG